MSDRTIPSMEEALDMELGAEDEQDISRVPDRIRLVLAFIGEAVGIVGGFVLFMGWQNEIPEGVLTGISMIVGAFIFCFFPIVALELKKYQYAAELSALDSQTQQMDYDWWEQIDVDDIELVMIPQYTLDNNLICWDEEVLDASIARLKQVVHRIGGRSKLNPTILDMIVESKIKDIIADRQEYNIFQRFILWFFRIKPQLVPTDFSRLAENWLSWTLDQSGLEVKNRVGLFSSRFEEYEDESGEVAIARAEKITLRRDEEEDIGIHEETPCGTKAWEIREVREFEKEVKRQASIIGKIERWWKRVFRSPYG